MPIIYKENGNSFFAASVEYELQEGEQSFPDYATEQELLDAFPNRATALSEKTKNDYLARINYEVNYFIFSRYDAGTQSSLHALYVDPDVSSEKKARIKQVFDYILGPSGIMKHYYATKVLLLAGTPLEATDWNLEQFANSDPQVTINEIISTE